VLIARLGARLGEAAVRQLDVRHDHRPECSTVKVAASTFTRTHTTQPPRPLWLFEHPRALGEGEAPWARHRLCCLSGPERIESGWWETTSVARDYYIARDAHGAVLWVFQELNPPHRWYLHGLFS
jgi:protein ImuB